MSEPFLAGRAVWEPTKPSAALAHMGVNRFQADACVSLVSTQGKKLYRKEGEQSIHPAPLSNAIVNAVSKRIVIPRAFRFARDGKGEGGRGAQFGHSQ